MCGSDREVSMELCHAPENRLDGTLWKKILGRGNMELNFDELRKYLIDYYGTAMTNGFPQAMFDLQKIEQASDEELIIWAKKAGIQIEEEC